MNRCVRCSTLFESKRKTAVCDNCHTAVCVVCGNEFELKWSYTAVACSSKWVRTDQFVIYTITE